MCNATAPTIVESSEVKEEQKPENMINVGAYFPSMIYDFEKTEFLETIKTSVNEALDLVKTKIQINPLYPVIQTESLLEDLRLREFFTFIAQTGFNILQQQGYAMDHLGVNFVEAWCQEHHKFSGMDQHIHGGNAQLVGFYFIDVPKNGCLPVFHDPRIGKNQVSFMEKDVNGVTSATSGITINPKEGMFVFANSWLPHSFTRNGSDEPCRFIHFTLGVQVAPPEHEPEVEIV
jgi:Putative 2OG-Fe(II) oxygenase